jgi:hypothetical protein
MGMLRAWLAGLVLNSVLVSLLQAAVPEVSDDAIAPHSITKRFSSFRTDLGKRQDGLAAPDDAEALDPLREDDDIEKRFSSFRTDLGKRSGDEDVDMDMAAELAKRFSAFRADLGKRFSAFRADLGKRAYMFRTDLGKRSYNEELQDGGDEGEDELEDKKRAMFRADLGKRAPFRADLGKRAPFRADLGKRFSILRSYWNTPSSLRDVAKRLQQFRADLGKRASLSAFRTDLGKRAPFRADLGKRSTGECFYHYSIAITGRALTYGGRGRRCSFAFGLPVPHAHGSLN